SLQRRAAEAVRPNDPDLAIIDETNGLDAPRTFASFRPLRMTHLINQAHVYQPMAFTHQGVNGTGHETPTKYPDPAKGWDREFLRQQVAEVRKFQQEHGARIYIGEFSAITWAEGADAYLRDCISLFEEYGWDWSYHAFREWSGWDVEKVCTKGARTGSPEFADAPDTPRKRVLLDGFRTLDARAAAESLHVVRELGVDGQPAIWNGHAVQFTYPPQFDFKAVPGAVGYRFTLIDDIHRVITMEAKLPTDPLTPVWTNLTDNGFVSVVAHGLDAAGEVCGLAGTRRFWKLPRFHPGKYPKARRGYLEAARLAYDYIFNLPSTQYFLKNGKPDPGYGLNAYPAKMHSALVSAMVRYAKLRPDRSADALRMARIAADYLLSISVPAGKPLAHFPPTYDNPKVGPGLGGVGPASQGKNMLLYPAQVGAAYLDLYGALGETKYLAAAEALAETYLRIQDKDGTCYLKVDQATGKPVNENRAFPLGICEFLERLQAVTGKKPYLEAAERGIGYVLSGPVKDWNWEGQFEDVEPSGKYVNLTKHPPCETALYLLKHRGKEEWVRRFAREVLRFSEDQFICWERPCRQDGTGPCSDRRSARDYLAWDCPGVLEQYKCYIPIDASISKVLITYAASWRETGDVLDLAKARALADALVNSQAESGRIPTFWTAWGRREPKSDWLNCMAFSAMTLEDFASVIGEGNPKSLK
ncbi:MAG: hypothetical protein KBT68_01590, partial [bacterium]|nr:hypothetical protein [Candidatus Colisoma equi]